MKEKQWLMSSDSRRMLEFVQRKQFIPPKLAARRRLRLFAVACCYNLQPWTWFENEQIQRLLRVAEEYAEGRATKHELHDARESAEPIFAAAEQENLVGNPWGVYAVRTLATTDDSANTAISAFAEEAVAMCVPDMVAWELWGQEEEIRKKQAQLFRDIFDNPFRSRTFDPAWRTPSVLAVARAIYAERLFADMPILADALEEAGCTNADILDHCRSGSEHVRGCWALDLVLGKE
jgi:hypothetical protein